MYGICYQLTVCNDGRASFHWYNSQNSINWKRINLACWLNESDMHYVSFTRKCFHVKLMTISKGIQAFILAHNFEYRSDFRLNLYNNSNVIDIPSMNLENKRNVEIYSINVHKVIFTGSKTRVFLLKNCLKSIFNKSFNTKQMCSLWQIILYIVCDILNMLK